jgi:hypothetical protein
MKKAHIVLTALKNGLAGIGHHLRFHPSPIPLRDKKPQQLELDWHIKAITGDD